MLFQRWPIVCDDSPTLKQHTGRLNVWCVFYLDPTAMQAGNTSSGNFRVLDFRELVILGHYTKSIIRELSISMLGNAIILINSRICPVCEFRAN